MSHQSPKSQRAKAPAEKPASDNLPEIVKGGTGPDLQSPPGSGAPKVPSGLTHAGGHHKGNVEAESAVPVHSSAPHQGGGPGFAKDTGDGSRTGGSVHQT